MTEQPLSAPRVDALAHRWEAIDQRIRLTCARAGRVRDEVTVIAVTKGHPLPSLRAVAALGLQDLGESYVQEWEPKAQAFAEQGDAAARWHFIGRLQSNKARLVAGRCALVHSVDRLSLARALARATPPQAPQRVLVQVDLAGEPQKGGCPPDQAAALLEACAQGGALLPCGLMTLPPQTEDEGELRRLFARLRALRDALRSGLDPSLRAGFTELSMGMSGDFEAAILEGATLVRIGTALMGTRG